VKYLFTTVQGLEDIVVEELAELGAVSASARYMSGRVVAEVPSGPRHLLSLRSVEKFGIFIASGSFEALPDIAAGVEAHLPEIEAYLSRASTVGVSTERVGEHPFTSRDVEAAVGRLFKERGYLISLVDPDVEINVDVVGSEYYVWLTALKESLRDRPYRVYAHYASLNPVVAYAMLRLAKPRPGETICDLTCGGGTICVEAALSAEVRCICVDISLRPLLGASANAEAAGVGGKIDFFLFDSTRLHRAFRPVCDAFIFNPPFGVRIPGNIRRLYRGLNKAMSRLARRDGARAVVITPRWRVFLEHFNGEVLERRVIYQGGIYSSIIVGVVERAN
jgi:tRNA (guanine6-N2)-methyltransferase